MAGVARRFGAQQMQRDAFGVGTLACQQSRGVGVQERSLACRQARVQRRGDQRVPKRQPGAFVEQRRGPQRVGGEGCRGGVEPGEAGGMAQGSTRAEHGDRARQRSGAARQPRELTLDDAPDLLGPERFQPCGGLVVRRHVVDGELGDQRPEHERVAARDGMAGVSEPGARRRQPPADERLARRRPERPRAHRRLRRSRQHVRQQLRGAGRLP